MWSTARRFMKPASSCTLRRQPRYQAHRDRHSLELIVRTQMKLRRVIARIAFYLLHLHFGTGEWLRGPRGLPGGFRIQDHVAHDPVREIALHVAALLE